MYKPNSKELLSSLTEKQSDDLMKIIRNVFDTNSHFVGLSDDDLACLDIALFGIDED